MVLSTSVSGLEIKDEDHNHTVVAPYVDEDDFHAPVVKRFQELHDFLHFVASGIAVFVICAAVVFIVLSFIKRILNIFITKRIE